MGILEAAAAWGSAPGTSGPKKKLSAVPDPRDPDRRMDRHPHDPGVRGSTRTRPARRRQRAPTAAPALRKSRLVVSHAPSGIGRKPNARSPHVIGLASLQYVHAREPDGLRGRNSAQNVTTQNGVLSENGWIEDHRVGRRYMWTGRGDTASPGRARGDDSGARFGGGAALAGSCVALDSRWRDPVPAAAFPPATRPHRARAGAPGCARGARSGRRAPVRSIGSDAAPDHRSNTA